MKCSDIDLLSFIDGKPSEGVQKHVANCDTCRKEVDSLSQFLKIVLPVYATGRGLEEDFNAHMRSLDITRMRPLPQAISRKVAEMKEHGLVSRMKKAVGKKKENLEEFVQSVMNPEMEALPASPKDLVKKKPKSSGGSAKPKRTRKPKS